MEELIVGIVALAFATFVVWLTVRIVNRQERSAIRMALALAGAVLLYAPSFGPACWLVDHEVFPYEIAKITYRPLTALITRCPPSVPTAFHDYSQIGSPENAYHTGFWLILDAP
jgi:hypothetical protein